MSVSFPLSELPSPVFRLLPVLLPCCCLQSTLFPSRAPRLSCLPLLWLSLPAPHQCSVWFWLRSRCYLGSPCDKTTVISDDSGTVISYWPRCSRTPLPGGPPGGPESARLVGGLWQFLGPRAAVLGVPVGRNVPPRELKIRPWPKTLSYLVGFERRQHILCLKQFCNRRSYV